MTAKRMFRAAVLAAVRESLEPDPSAGDERLRIQSEIDAFVRGPAPRVEKEILIRNLAGVVGGSGLFTIGLPAAVETPPPAPPAPEEEEDLPPAHDEEQPSAPAEADPKAIPVPRDGEE